MTPTPSILLIHRGGLGDFLSAWPAMLSIREQFPKNTIYWLGLESRLEWLLPLDVRPCPPDLRRHVESLFARSDWPEELHDIRVFWFVLDKRPPVPEHPNLVVLHGIYEKRLIPPREVYASELRANNVAWQSDWLAKWRGEYGRCKSEFTSAPREIFLFPGAGHPAKQWPLVQFLELARWLQSRGKTVRFVLGPAEVDRGMDVPGTALMCPETLKDLVDVLGAADFVVGNDSGPMHLAGMLGVPGVVLFGPASERQWAPVGVRTLGLDMPCRPCTQSGRIMCPEPTCMKNITQQMVRRALVDMAVLPRLSGRSFVEH